MQTQRIVAFFVALIFVAAAVMGAVGVSQTSSDTRKFQAREKHDNKNERWVQVIGDKEGVYDDGFGTSSNFATRGMSVYKGELFVGTQSLDFSKVQWMNIKRWTSIALLAYRSFEHLQHIELLLHFANGVVPLHGLFSDGCELWKYNHTQGSWRPLVSNKKGAVIPSGFGQRSNFAAAVIQPFQDALYIGTATSSLTGCEMWRWDDHEFEKVVEHGFNNRFNSGVWCSAVYNHALYVGTMNWKHGCQVWRTHDGDTWEQVQLPGGDGFGNKYNVYAWSMGVYDNCLYLGTCSLDPERGCQLWKYNGSVWGKVDLPGGDGFGEVENYGIRNIVCYQDELYVSTATNIAHHDEACEVWRYDGRRWHPIINDNNTHGDGFGDLHNKYAWSMLPRSDGSLWIGTLNLQSFSEDKPRFSTQGCELWTYTQESWIQVVGEKNNEATGGFGNPHNIGARSMVEYPRGSGIMWVGTMTMDVTDFASFAGCQIWKRTVRTVS